MKDFGAYITVDCPECGKTQSRGKVFHSEKGTDWCDPCAEFEKFFTENLEPMSVTDRLKRVEKFMAKHSRTHFKHDVLFKV